ncbi:MAG: lysine--tRNA ligase [Minwuia sp.]|uniref:lysine--tRNA ligase n=1 Tax=Minwuia sp. TaxID=2493630 RepID=UPI003A83D84F
MSDIRDIAMESNAWPFKEARDLLKRVEKSGNPKGEVLFETGYGPSGLPHIGTFGEVARTTMVRIAFQALAPDVKTRLIAFSDDMDGLRKVPGNIPNRELIEPHLGKPLTVVPDPFGTHPSFGQHNNARLQAFLDQFGFEYEFRSATDCYKAGEFDEVLKLFLVHYDAVLNVILPTLGPERRATYSPFLPVCPETGRVLMVPVIERDADAGTIVYQREDGKKIETPVTGGAVKMQWKADWAMRWRALGVDYEMSGKDLIDSVKLSSQICRILGGTPPNGFTYELFLDQNGEKISKTKGNGLSIEEWLTYASPESLSLFMFQQPKRAKRLHFDVIPKAVDEYLSFSEKYRDEDPAKQLQNPVWHIHSGHPPVVDSPVSFGMLLNLASVCNTEDKAVLWGFITRYAPDATPESNPVLDNLVGYALAYYRDFVKPSKAYRDPTAQERAAMADLAAQLGSVEAGASGEEIQNLVYEVGKAHGFENLRDWFKALYEVLFGQSQGPRFGSFVALYGVSESIALIEEGLAREAA